MLWQFIISRVPSCHAADGTGDWNSPTRAHEAPKAGGVRRNKSVTLNYEQ